MKTKITIVLLVCLLFATSLILSASENGASIFNTKCMQCHKSGGSAPAISPQKYVAKSWDRFFSRQKHKRKKDISKLFTKQELNAVLEYLKKNAYDARKKQEAGI